MLRFIIGSTTWIGGMMMLAYYRLCLTVMIYSVIVLYLWTVFIIPAERNLPFYLSVRIYNSLRIMTVQQGELAREFVTVCLHHFYLVLLSTSALYYFLMQFMPGYEMSIVLSILCCTVFLIAFILESFAVGVVSKGSALSKEFLRKMRVNNGRFKRRRKILHVLCAVC